MSTDNMQGNYSNYQYELSVWSAWNSQSSEYKLNHTEPKKPQAL